MSYSQGPEPILPPGTIAYARIEFVGGPYDGVSEPRRWSDLKGTIRLTLDPRFEKRGLTTGDSASLNTSSHQLIGRYSREPNQEFEYVAIAETELDEKGTKDRVIEEKTVELRPLILTWAPA
jgi:hypothetical protein